MNDSIHSQLSHSRDTTHPREMQDEYTMAKLDWHAYFHVSKLTTNLEDILVLLIEFYKIIIYVKKKTRASSKRFTKFATITKRSQRVGVDCLCQPSGVDRKLYCNIWGLGRQDINKRSADHGTRCNGLIARGKLQERTDNNFSYQISQSTDTLHKFQGPTNSQKTEGAGQQPLPAGSVGHQEDSTHN